MTHSTHFTFILVRAALALALATGVCAKAGAQSTETLGGYTFTVETDDDGSYYKVDCEAALRGLSTYVKAGNQADGKRFKQTADITMTSGNFFPIGKAGGDETFDGTYDGGNYTISGLTISETYGCIGLFGYVGWEASHHATVKNVVLVNPSVTATDNSNFQSKVGTVAGFCDEGVTIDNCIVINPTVNVSGTNKVAGAIVGQLDRNSDTATNCYFYDSNAGHNYDAIGNNEDGATVNNVARAYTLTLGSGVTTSTAAAFTYSNASYYAGTVTLAAAPDGWIYAYSVNGNAISGNAFSIAADATVSLTSTPDPAHFSQSGDEYTIHTATGWGVFCDCLQDNDTYNRFSGKTVRLGADIAVTRMAGSDSHDFCGTFDGGGNTLTFNHGTSDSYASDEYTAPFRYVSTVTPSGGSEVPTNFRNLHVAGNIYTTAKYAAGIVGRLWGTVTIENCAVSTVIHSDINGDGTHGGIVALNSGTLSINGCVFDGKLLSTGTNATTNCGGFVGYGNGTITNSLYAPADLGTGETEVQTGDVNNHPSATFARDNATVTNSYYTRALGTAQGKARRTVSGGENVTVAVSPVGSPVENGTYTVSGITAYTTGIKYNGVLYAGSGDNVSLTLANTATGAPHGYQYDTYTATTGTLTGSTASGWTLQMADADATISLDTSQPHSTGQPVTLSYVTADGTPAQTDQAIALDGTETSLAAGTYFADLPTVQFDHTLTLTGNVTLILADNCHMNVGTSGERIDGKGIDGIDGNATLTIYSQSLGDDMGALNVYTTGENEALHTAAITINGGNVTADTEGYGSVALRAGTGAVTINNGNVTAHTAGADAVAIFAISDFNYNGGNVNASATGTGTYKYAIWAHNGNYTFSWRTPADRITIGTTGLYATADKTATFTRLFTDATGNYYGATLTGTALNALKGVTLEAAETADFTVTLAPKGYGTYYDGHYDITLPAGTQARIVTARGDTDGTLDYETIADGDDGNTLPKTIPAGTAVMLCHDGGGSVTLTVNDADIDDRDFTKASGNTPRPRQPPPRQRRGHDDHRRKPLLQADLRLCGGPRGHLRLVLGSRGRRRLHQPRPQGMARARRWHRRLRRGCPRPQLHLPARRGQREHGDKDHRFHGLHG